MRKYGADFMMKSEQWQLTVGARLNGTGESLGGL
jgi:hypothetical protein